MPLLQTAEDLIEVGFRTLRMIPIDTLSYRDYEWFLIARDYVETKSFRINVDNVSSPEQLIRVGLEWDISLGSLRKNEAKRLVNNGSL